MAMAMKTAKKITMKMMMVVKLMIRKECLQIQMSMTSEISIISKEYISMMTLIENINAQRQEHILNTMIYANE